MIPLYRSVHGYLHSPLDGRCSSSNLQPQQMAGFILVFHWPKYFGHKRGWFTIYILYIHHHRWVKRSLVEVLILNLPRYQYEPIYIYIYICIDHALNIHWPMGNFHQTWDWTWSDPLDLTAVNDQAERWRSRLARLSDAPSGCESYNARSRGISASFSLKYGKYPTINKAK